RMPQVGRLAAASPHRARPRAHPRAGVRAGRATPALVGRRGARPRRLRPGEAAEMITFFVAGTPAPQGSKRYLGNRGGKGITVESSERVAPWRADIRAEAQRVISQPLDGPVR